MTSYHHFYKELHRIAHQRFASLKGVTDLPWENLISPLTLRLPKSVLSQAHAAIGSLFNVSRLEAYQRQLGIPPLPFSQNANHSVLMAYDFHTDEDGRCYLVEINTNAAGFMISALTKYAHGQESETSLALEKLKAAFLNEAKLSGHPFGSSHSLAIVDEDITAQKMYAEFLMYRDWFEQQGWDAFLCEAQSTKRSSKGLENESGKQIHFIYNRLTDFYLEDSGNQSLRESYIANEACFSPNPKEYWLLADKQRLIQLSQPGFLEATGASSRDIEQIRQVLIPTFEKSSFSSEEQIWSERKSLFFKPKRSYGGKSVYRGESVSRRVFERLMQDDILVQKFVPAQKMPVDDPRSVLSHWKFDLRFYVYEAQIQMVMARIYQGQVTNFSSSMGGFTMVEF